MSNGKAKSCRWNSNKKLVFFVVIHVRFRFAWNLHLKTETNMILFQKSILSVFCNKHPQCVAESTSLMRPMSKKTFKISCNHCSVGTYQCWNVCWKIRCKNLEPLDETCRSVVSVSSLFLVVKCHLTENPQPQMNMPTLHPHHHKKQTNFMPPFCPSVERTLDISFSVVCPLFSVFFNCFVSYPLSFCY